MITVWALRLQNMGFTASDQSFSEQLVLLKATEMKAMPSDILLFLNWTRKRIKRRRIMNKRADLRCLFQISVVDVKEPLAFYLAIILFNPV